MSAYESARSRFASDLSEDEILQSFETYCNGAFYPKRGVLLSRISKLSEHDIGTFGELAAASPFYLAYRTSSYISSRAESKIKTERADVRYDGESFCFLLSREADSLEPAQHNALKLLSEKTSAAWYVAPLFARRKSFMYSRNSDKPADKNDDAFYARGVNAGTSPLARFAMIAPHAQLDKNDTRYYYSYSVKGETAFHGEKAEKIKQESFIARDLIRNITGEKMPVMDLGVWADEIISCIPDLFGQPSGSRKVKTVIENLLYEQIDESEVGANHSTQKILDSLDLYGKLMLIEKLLRRHFGIIQYFRLEFKG